MNTPLGHIIHGDCIEALCSMQPGSARLVVADPPYFNVLIGQNWDTAWPDEAKYLEWTARWIGAAMQVLVPGGLLYCFGQVGKREHAMLHLMSQAALAHTFHDLLIWDRAVGYTNRRDSWTPAYEMALVLRKDGAPVCFDKGAVREPYSKQTRAAYARDKRYKNMDARREHLKRGKYATNLWRIPSLKGSSKEKCGHPSQKPLALIERIVKSSSAPGDLVVDPFLGSGTTAVAAQKLGRRWIGIEADAEYVAMARQRLESSGAA
jgi:site-specific DNA-methyltransferase (adenine-specific)